MCFNKFPTSGLKDNKMSLGASDCVQLCIQNPILALVVFEMAMKKTLNLFFRRRPRFKPVFFVALMS